MSEPGAYDSPDSCIRVLICDDHTLVQHGLIHQLAQNDRLQVVGVLQDGSDLEKYFFSPNTLPSDIPEVLLLDFSLPEKPASDHRFDVLAFTKKLHGQYPSLKIIFITMFDQPALVQTALLNGASGFFTKDDAHAMDHLAALICQITETHQIVVSPGLEPAMINNTTTVDFSGTQNAILALILQEPSISSSEIAERLSMASSTVRNQLSRIYRKLDVSSRAEAVLAIERLGWQPESKQPPQLEQSP